MAIATNLTAHVALSLAEKALNAKLREAQGLIALYKGSQFKQEYDAEPECVREISIEEAVTILYPGRQLDL